MPATANVVITPYNTSRFFALAFLISPICRFAIFASLLMAPKFEPTLSIFFDCPSKLCFMSTAIDSIS